MRSFFTRPKIGALPAALLAAFALATASPAADVTDIGYVDQSALAGIPSFVNANRELGQYKAQLDKQFAAQIRRVRDQNTQARIAQAFQNKLAQRQRDVMQPLLQRAQVAIASVASSKNLSVIVDRRIIILGGQDVTRNVIDLLTGPGDPIPPVNTPPPSEVGFVDQTQIDQVPRLKAANDEFLKFQNDQQGQAQQKLRAAKTDADRQQVLKDLRKTIGDKQQQLISPLVDQTRDVIASVAKKRGLLLVIDRGNLIYGGTDITSDVTAALNK